MRARLALIVVVPAFLLILLIWHLKSSVPTQNQAGLDPSLTMPSTTLTLTGGSDSAPTAVYAHNLMLRKGPYFRIYVRWLRGNMVRTRRDVNPTFDDPESFFLEIKTGVIRDVTLWAIYLGPELSAPNGRK